VNGTKIVTRQENELLEQLMFTDYYTNRMWYRTKISGDSSSTTTIKFIGRRMSAYQIYIDGEFKGEVADYEEHPGDIPISVQFENSKKDYILAIISISFGLHNGIHKENKESKGVRDVTVNGRDVSSNLWYHQKATAGENLRIYDVDKDRRMDVPWDHDVPKYVNQPLVWYKAIYDVPKEVCENAVINPLSVKIEANTLFRGHIFVNGFDLGMYLTLPGVCEGDVPCTDVPYVKEECGKPTQVLYHIPPEFVLQTNNRILIIEEKGGDPINVQIVRKA